MLIAGATRIVDVSKFPRVLNGDSFVVPSKQINSERCGPVDAVGGMSTGRRIYSIKKLQQVFALPQNALASEDNKTLVGYNGEE